MIDLQKFNISVIAAINRSNGIGYQDKMLYNIDEDLKYFKELKKLKLFRVRI